MPAPRQGCTVIVAALVFSSDQIRSETTRGVEVSAAQMHIHITPRAKNALGALKSLIHLRYSPVEAPSLCSGPQNVGRAPRMFSVGVGAPMIP